MIEEENSMFTLLSWRNMMTTKTAEDCSRLRIPRLENRLLAHCLKPVAVQKFTKMQ